MQYLKYCISHEDTNRVVKIDLFSMDKIIYLYFCKLLIFVMRVKLILVKLSFCVGFSQYLYMMNLGSTFTAIVIVTNKSDMKKFILKIEF